MTVTETAYRDRGDVTELLLAWSGGEPRAEQRLLSLVYDELHGLAASYMRRERAEHTLQPTALVHEAYMRLVDQERVEWRNRAHFFAIAAQMMRRILVDHARRRQAARRGDNQLTLPLADIDALGFQLSPDIVAVDEALAALATLDGEKSRIVEMRFFGGLSNEEIAEVLGVSLATIARHWRVARAWLYRYMTSDVPDAV
jgi:RNA polymerase sigma-70 factor (ECF subfamily)